jgi:hypothetical protein
LSQRHGEIHQNMSLKPSTQAVDQIRPLSVSTITMLARHKSMGGTLIALPLVAKTSIICGLSE